MPTTSYNRTHVYLNRTNAKRALQCVEKEMAAQKVALDNSTRVDERGMLQQDLLQLSDICNRLSRQAFSTPAEGRAILDKQEERKYVLPPATDDPDRHINLNDID